jgi:hypothetical protein
MVELDVSQRIKVRFNYVTWVTICVHWWFICKFVTFFFILIFIPIRLILLLLLFLLLFRLSLPLSLLLLLLLLRLPLFFLLLLFLILLLLVPSSSPPPSEVFLHCSGFSRPDSLPPGFPIYPLAFQTFTSLCLFEGGVRPTQFDDSPYGLFTELGSSSPIPSMEEETTSLSGNSFETCPS